MNLLVQNFINNSKNNDIVLPISLDTKTFLLPTVIFLQYHISLRLIDFDIPIYFPHENGGTPRSHSPAHQKECKTKQKHVAKIIAYLK